MADIAEGIDMFETESLLILALAGPILGAIITAAIGPKVLRERSHIPVVAGVTLAVIASLALAAALWQELTALRSQSGEAFSLESTGPDQGPAPAIGFEKVVTLWTWASIEQAYPIASEGGETASRPFQISITLRIDGLTVFMLVMVTVVSLLVVIYSIGYMAGDPGYWRFFAYLGLFVFSMMMLVSVSNFLLLYVFWEAVGLCSYLLIGFWYHRPAAAAAAKKAFLVNRVGDFGFALGVFLLWTAYGTLNMHDTPTVPGIFGQMRLAAGTDHFVGNLTGVAIALLLFWGACGKSAQFPLHVWLPDAMEGPTPVSALIHAATMVTAGVYLVARCAPLYQVAPEAQIIIAVVGTFTALLAALIALTQTDLKRILAYSTISQLGYMFTAVGLGTSLAIAAGMFHLFTHAFFKALLFLGAGSVMHALNGEIDLRNFGGLWRRLPWTHLAFLIGALALAGIFPLAGFWSKDAILHELLEHGDSSGLKSILFWVLLVTAGLTAFYTFRAFFWAFHGQERFPESLAAGGHRPHESPKVMLVPMIVLAVGAVGAGWIDFLPGGVHGLLASTPSVEAVRTPSEAESHSEYGALAKNIALWSSMSAGIGILTAALLYLPFGYSLLVAITRITKTFGLYGISYGKFFFDELYDYCIVTPLKGLAKVCQIVDQKVVDLGLVDGCARVLTTAGSVLRQTQRGAIASYALAMLGAVLVFLMLLLL
jgi:NADH-quinone oxidoreductase subunit L